MFADNWNVFTARFLQFCVYERVAYNKVQWTFMLSATWHGFYPGYYGMFFPLAFGILASRKVNTQHNGIATLNDLPSLTNRYHYAEPRSCLKSVALTAIKCKNSAIGGTDLGYDFKVKQEYQQNW